MLMLFIIHQASAASGLSDSRIVTAPAWRSLGSFRRRVAGCSNSTGIHRSASCRYLKADRHIEHRNRAHQRLRRWRQPTRPMRGSKHRDLGRELGEPVFAQSFEPKRELAGPDPPHLRSPGLGDLFQAQYFSELGAVRAHTQTGQSRDRQGHLVGTFRGNEKGRPSDTKN